MEGGSRVLAARALRAKAFHIFALFFFVYIFLLCMKFTLNDPDLWWHLKTGEYIIEKWEVPEVDPFAYTTPRPLSKFQKIGLRAHWLGQVVFYAAYLIGGLNGVGILRNLLVVLPMALLYVWFVRGGLRPWAALVVISFPALILSIQIFYAFERPQGISFLLALLVVIALEGLRKRLGELQKAGRRLGTLEIAKELRFFLVLPLIMAVWGNIHGGYIFGSVIVVIYLAGEAAGFVLRRMRSSADARYFGAFALFSLLSLAFSFANPNGHSLFSRYVVGHARRLYVDAVKTATGAGGGWVKDVVLEYRPLYYFYTELSYTWLVFFWIFTAIVIVVLAARYFYRRSVDVTEVLVVFFIVFFSNYYARGMMFALVLLPFFLGRALLETDVSALRRAVVFKTLIALCLSVSIGFLTFTYKVMPYVFKVRVTNEWVTPWYPKEAADFIIENKIEGPMYNFYTWGGFLIWKMYPQYQVFIDGRAIDDLVNRTADFILKTFPGWEKHLDAYNINFIVVPVVFRESGHIVPLAAALTEKDDWKLVFIMQNSAVFVRDVPKNWEIVRKYNYTKDAVFKEIITVENIFLVTQPWNPVYSVAKADALYSLGRFEEAKAIYERFPQESAQMLKRLKGMGY